MSALVGGIELGRPVVGWRALPYQPRWWGLAADVAFWGGAWALIAWGIARYRTARRRSRGLCTACGYDLRGSDAGQCPECGAAVSRRIGSARGLSDAA